MAIKQRVLDKLATIEKDFIEASEAKPQEALADALVLLSETKNECRQGLPESRHADYDELCDGLMLALGQLATGQATEDKGEVLSLCGDLLKILNKKIEDEGGFKKEIVFLPYKSSMWDSLESVWRAACEDKEHCIPYVIPIPYADLTPEHTVAEWHCEKDIFPKDVPVVDWQTVDLAVMHPDVIFIHNPYDEYNRVTSVESRYYSSILTRQTDKLVYIPYFVINEPETDGKTEDDIEKIENDYEPYILTPAVLNSHQIIVQSEIMRQVYIDVLTRRTDRTDRAFWEKRILGTGSPKFDKVATTKREDLDIPEQWLKIIRKPDGSWKKIIFYNTGLSALLHNDEKMLAKMRQVFQTFKEHKDEIALLWRPHPLIPATIQSMRPQLSEEYTGIVKQYKEEAWGIYDDSADVDRAVVLSDAYYGDWSSVVQLYQQTSKSILVQNVNAVVNTGRLDFIPLKFYDVSFFEDYMYFSAANFNALFRVKSGEQTAEFLGHFCNVPLNQGGLHRRCIPVEDMLYFIPMYCKGIHSYHISTRQFSFVPMVGEDAPAVRCSNAYLFGKKIFLVPFTHEDEFYCYDIENRRVEPLQVLTKITKETQKRKPGTWIDFQGSVVAGDTLYIVVYDTNILMKINLRTYRLEKIALPIEAKLQTINYIGGVFWFTTTQHAIIWWNETTQELKKIPIPNMSGAETFGHPYLRILQAHTKLMVAQGRIDACWLYDEEKDTWENLHDSTLKAFRRNTDAKIVLWGDYHICPDGNILLSPKAGDEMALFFPCECAFASKTIQTGTDFQEHYRRILADSATQFMETHGMIIEGWMSMNDFLYAICAEQFDSKNRYMPLAGKKHSPVGQIIYEQICN